MKLLAFEREKVGMTSRNRENDIENSAPPAGIQNQNNTEMYMKIDA